MRTIVLLPVHNEGPTLPALLAGLVPRADAVIAVDDGSDDDSAALLEAAAARDSRVEVLRSDRNRGKSRALELAFRRVAEMLASGQAGPDDAVMTMDADGQIPAETVERAAARFAAGGLDMLVGRRDLSLYPRIKRLGNAVLTGLASRLAGFRFSDTLCGFRVIRAGAVPRLLEFYRAEGYTCEQELSIIGVRLGLRTANDFVVPIARFRSNPSWRDAAAIAADSFRTRWRTRKLPRR